MRVAQLDFADPSFPVSLVDRDDPPLPGPDWARVAVTAGGICGSDLHVLRPHEAGSSPTLTPYVRLPMEMGHEVAGMVVEAGSGCPVPEGTPVAVDPTMGCAARGLDPCPACASGAASVCRNLDVGDRTGLGLGFSTGLGGGWSDHLLAHVSQLHPVPEGLTDPATVALTEPLSVVVHGLLRHEPTDGDPVLVVGAGIIGLAAVAAARALLPASEVTVVARHDHQEAAATALGAHHVVRDGDDVLERLAAPVGARVTGRGDGALLVGGYPVTVEAVGTPTAIGLALRATAARGRVHLMGAAGQVPVDLAPVWFHELDVVGTFCHAVDHRGGVPGHSFDRALELLAAGALPADVVVTHTFPQGALREAVDTAFDRRAGAIKVQVVPDGDGAPT